MERTPPYSHFDHERKTGRLLADHLARVGARAASFSRHFPHAFLADQSGRAHDLGKHKKEFQSYLLGTTTAKTTHSITGAILAQMKLDHLGLMHAYPIAGHHAGLPDYAIETAGEASLEHRLAAPHERAFAQSLSTGQEIFDMTGVRLPNDPNFSIPFFIRMSFSSLVDADWLDAEDFYRPNDAAARAKRPGLPALKARLDAKMAEMAVPKDGANLVLHGLRQQVLAACREKAAEPVGLFSLNVPTGYGKTLSGMTFALDHAIAHGLDRVIYVAPFISIIDQTADILRGIFGNEAVVEHHSGIDPDEIAGNLGYRNKLDTQNWDAPIIVTTAVQLFESLYSNRTARCRKLHNISGSVILLDEAQAVPTECVAPIAHVIDQLTRYYRTSIVLATATQPGFPDLYPALSPCREIAPDPAMLYAAMRRVRVYWPESWARWSWSDVATEALRHQQCLTIVDGRKAAHTLYAELISSGREGVYHLSTHQCPAHRRAILAEVRERLKNTQPVQLVSTRLIEAGVNLSFPTVLRSLAGIDSIIQAAGRCNREGEDPTGCVIVFVPDDIAAMGHVHAAAEATKAVVKQFRQDAFSPAAVQHFFTLLWWAKGDDALDGKKVLPFVGMVPANRERSRILTKDKDHLKLRYSFASAAEAFRMIDDREAAVVVSYDGGAAVIRDLLDGKNDGALMRRAAKFSASVPLSWIRSLIEDGQVTEAQPGIYVQADPGAYTNEVGWDACPA